MKRFILRGIDSAKQFENKPDERIVDFASPWLF